MQVSYSRISSYKQCPYLYKLRYIDNLTTKFNLDSANALVLGTAIHTGIEQNTLEAIKYYYSNYPTATASMINQAIILEIMIEKAKQVIPVGDYETLIEDKDFKGFIDLLVFVEKDKNGIEWYDLYDFKYSNNVKNYLESGQLHIYKYYFEKLNSTKKIRNLYFAFIPKVKLKQEQYEDITKYRERLIAECEKQEINIVKVDYDYNKVINFLLDTKHCIECKEFNKNKSNLCYWCDFKRYCNSNGEDDGNIIYPNEIKKEEM
ncbi:MAG: PD-(D/E)XK nuclease family protein [Candidatus Onthovivens sp.]|nr:PD-(D/E)XK nuclease family protein [Candidatus Onthovivens sp.]